MLWLRLLLRGTIAYAVLAMVISTGWLGCNSFKACYDGIGDTFDGLPAPLLTALIGASIAWMALRTNASVNLRNQRIQVILNCNARYDELYALRDKIEGKEQKNSHEARSYFRRYWGLKSDQLDYWLAGYVDPETLASWFMATVRDLSETNGNIINPKEYMEKWNEFKEDHRVTNERFYEFVEFITSDIATIKITDLTGNDRTRDCQYAAILQYLRFIEHREQSFISKLTRVSRRRMLVDQYATTLRSDPSRPYIQFDPRGMIVRWWMAGRISFRETIDALYYGREIHEVTRLRNRMALTIARIKNSPVSKKHVAGRGTDAASVAPLPPS